MEHLHRIAPYLCSFLILACRAGTASAAPIETLAFDGKNLPRGIEVTGKIVDGAHWRDATGENFLILTETRKQGRGECATPERCSQAAVHAYHYVLRGGVASLVWKLTDHQGNCGPQVYAGFIPKSLTLTDLDSDGVAETTFLYKKSCRSDVSPSDLRLIMHRGKEQYEIDGTTKILQVPEASGAGKMAIGSALEKAGNPFKKYCIEQWKKFVVEDLSDGN